MTEGKRTDTPSHAQQLPHQAHPPASRQSTVPGDLPGRGAREVDESFRALAEAAEEYGVCLLDPQGLVASWGCGSERLYGYPPEEILGQHFSHLFTAKDIGRTGPEHWLRIARAEGRFKQEAWCVRKDGSSFPADVVLAALHGEAGQLHGFSLVTRNVTEHKEAVEALALRDRALGAVTQGVFLTDMSRPDNPIVYVNPALERMTGRAPAELIGRRAWFLEGPTPNLLTRAEIEAVFREKRAWSGEVLIRGKDGTMCWHKLSLVPGTEIAGREAPFAGVLTDLREQKHREEQFLQVQRMEVVGWLASGVAHDLNNLLTAIFGWCDLLLLGSGPGDPVVRESLEQIKLAAESGASLTRHLLSLGREPAPLLQTLDLAIVIAKMERLLRQLLGKNIKLVTTAEPGLSWVQADRAQVEQILLNLAFNARDAMPGGGRLTVELSNTVEGPLSYVRLAMTDTGCGMSEEVLGRIFEPFFTTKEPDKGTGLGLFTVREIVKQSGGQIRVYSRPDQGTRFEIYLPRSKEGAPAERPRRAPPG